MPVINLIQEQREALQKLEQRARIGLVAFIGVAAATGFGYGIVFFEGQGLQSEIARLNLELKRTGPIVAEITDNDRIQGQLGPRLSALENAQKQSDRWAHILQHLRTQTPPSTWLTALQGTVTQDDKPISITIQGNSNAQEPIGEFILRTQNEPDLENVLLHFTQEKRSPTGEQISFEIAADVAGTAEKPRNVKEAGHA